MPAPPRDPIPIVPESEAPPIVDPPIIAPPIEVEGT
jgi:hypothetical protein